MAARRWLSAAPPPLLLLGLLFASAAVLAAADNNKCCPSGANKAKCENNNYHEPGHENDPYYEGVEKFARCFGATGAGCKGIPDEEYLLKLVPKGLSPLIKNNGDGTADGVVTIGSILHDTCCIHNPWGLFCSSINRPILTFNWKSSDCACADEWRTAVYELFKGYAWRARMPYEVGVPPPALKCDADASHSRTAYQRVSFAKFGPKPVRHTGLNENAATKSLQAPDGTRLSCPENIAECDVQCSKDDEKNGKCKRTLTMTTRYFKEKGIKAGNSEFCASGVFVSITRGLAHSYGVCGTPTDAAAKKAAQDRIEQKKNEILAMGSSAEDKAAIKKYFEGIKNMPYTDALPDDSESALESTAKKAQSSGKSEEEIDNSFLGRAKTWLQGVGQKAYSAGRSAIDAVTSWVKWF